MVENNRCFRSGGRLYCELASVGRVLVGRRPNDQADYDQTAVCDAGSLSPDRHDLSHLKPDNLRLDGLQHP